MITHIIVSESSMKAKDDASVILSNVNVIEALLRSFLTREELFPEALKSYYVNLYVRHMADGGFAEFVYRTGWDKVCVSYLVAGLEAINAHEHLDLLGKFAERLVSYGADGIECLYDDKHPQNQQMREYLNADMPEFFALSVTEDLVMLNSKWLKNHSELVVMSEANLKKQIDASSKALPNRMQRIAKALASEPRHMKLIRLLCDNANLDFLYLSPADGVSPTNSQQAAIWHFEAVQGRFYLSDLKSEATLCNSLTHAQLARVKITDVEMARS
jgi:hypothetical protein